MPSSVTEGIRVSVQSLYLPSDSRPTDGRFVFAYTVQIRNEGERVAQLRSRRWVITDALGRMEEVNGPGVVGEQPVLRPGESFAYTSGAVLRTPWGTMTGTYTLIREDGGIFDANIPSFLLSDPERCSGARN